MVLKSEIKNIRGTLLIVLDCIRYKKFVGKQIRGGRSIRNIIHRAELGATENPTSMSLKKYQQFTFETLIDDPDFRQWVSQPTEEKNQLWEAYLKANPTEREKLEKAQKIILELNQYYEKELPDSIAPDPNFAKLLTNIVRLDKAEQQRTLTKLKVQRRWMIAATIAALLSVGLWFLAANDTETGDNWVVHTTDFGEWKKLQLPDGSTVHLNANSELKLNEDWAVGADRQVWLKGEAFFEVEKKRATNAKFKVMTNALEVEVLGTQFNVKSKGENTQVFLEEGEIQLTTTTQQLALKPNDFIDYTKGQTALKVSPQTLKKEKTSWKDGTLILSEQRVATILQRLEEIYGCSFEVQRKSLLEERKTLAIPMKNLEVILPILERTLGVEIEKKDNQIYLN